MSIGERYEGIVSAACGVIARRGFHQASIREIARAAGLSVAGLYHYVGEKDELLFLVLGRSLDRLLADLERNLAEARTAEDRLLADDVRRVLGDLPPRQRRAVELAVFGGLTHSEIAAALDTPLGTVKSWLRQGLRQLRASLGPSWPEVDA